MEKMEALEAKLDLLMKLVEPKAKEDDSQNPGKLRWLNARLAGKRRDKQGRKARSRWQFMLQQYRQHVAEVQETALVDEEQREVEAARQDDIVAAIMERRAMPFLRRIRTRWQKGRLLQEGFHVEWYISLPTSTFTLVWTLMTTIAVLFVAAELPVRLAFLNVDDVCGYYVLDRILDTFFIIDVIKNFFSGYNEPDGQLVVAPRAVALNYLRTWFTLDVLASIPFDAIVSAAVGAKSPCDASSVQWGDDSPTVGSDALALLNLVRCLKLGKLLRIGRVLRAMDSQLMSSSSARYVGLIQRVLIFFIISHVVGCVLFLFARMDSFASCTWVVRADMIQEGCTFPILKDTASTFNASLADGCAPPRLMLSELYSRAFYHAVVMMITAAGINQPDCSWEFGIAVPIIMIGTYLFADLVSAIATTVQTSEARRQYQERNDLARAFLRHKQVPFGLRNKIFSYYALRNPGSMFFDEREFLNGVSTPLRREVMRHICKPVLRSLHLENSSDVTLIGAVVDSLEFVCFVFHDIIISEGQLDVPGLFVIGSGNCEILVKARRPESFRRMPSKKKSQMNVLDAAALAAGVSEDEHLIVVNNLKAGDMFGEMSLVNEGSAAKATVRCSSFFDGYVLTREGYSQVCKIYPLFQRHIEALAARRLGQSRRHKAFVCGENQDASAPGMANPSAGSFLQGSTGLANVSVELMSRSSFRGGVGSVLKRKKVASRRKSCAATTVISQSMSVEEEARAARKHLKRRTLAGGANVLDSVAVESNSL